MDSSFSRWKELYTGALIDYLKRNTSAHIGDIEGFAHSDKVDYNASHEDNYNAFVVYYKDAIDNVIGDTDD